MVDWKKRLMLPKLGDNMKVIKLEDDADDDLCSYKGKIGILSRIKEQSSIPYELSFEDGRKLEFYKSEVEVV